MSISSFEVLDVMFKPSLEKEIANISAPGPQIKKEETLLSKTLKFEEKNVYLTFFILRPSSQDMSISSFEALDVRFKLSSEEEIANISAPRPQIKIVRTPCFLKL